MEKLKLRLKRQGNSYAFIVPMDFVKQGRFIPLREYEVIIEEVRRENHVETTIRTYDLIFNHIGKISEKNHSTNNKHAENLINYAIRPNRSILSV